ncbi:MAG: GAF domain-containing protein [Acidimicrobiales bacterium]
MDQGLRQRRSELESVWRTAVEEHRSTPDARPEVFASWQRSSQTVAVDLLGAPIREPVEVSTPFLESRLGRASQVILEDLRDIAADGDLIAALTDESVTIRWLVGGRHMRRRADGVNFAVGGCWSEEAVGTNALALAHRLARPATVFSAEHYAPMVHDWACSSAPIFDPVDGRSLGVIDVSSPWTKHSPSLLTLVRALARNVEVQLTREGTEEREISATGTSELVIRVLGAAGVWVNGVPVRLAPRQLEILAILVMHEHGLTLDELTALIYGDQPISPTTVKAELSHMRRLLGDVLQSRPYRLRGRVDADHVRVLSSLSSGDLAAALDLYRGSLLPMSESPAISSWRHQIDVAVRNAVLRSRNPELLYRLSGSCPHDDEVTGLALALMASDDLRRGIVAGRLAPR